MLIFDQANDVFCPMAKIMASSETLTGREWRVFLRMYQAHCASVPRGVAHRTVRTLPWVRQKRYTFPNRNGFKTVGAAHTRVRHVAGVQATPTA